MEINRAFVKLGSFGRSIRVAKLVPHILSIEVVTDLPGFTQLNPACAGDDHIYTSPNIHAEKVYQPNILTEERESIDPRKREKAELAVLEPTCI